MEKEGWTFDVAFDELGRNETTTPRLMPTPTSVQGLLIFVVANLQDRYRETAVAFESRVL